MAAPTVQYARTAPGTGSSSLQAFMVGIQTGMLASGWTTVYADSDAIGGGSSGTPAWDKTPAPNTDAGVAVYRMPANGHATQWFVRIVARWGNATTRPAVTSLTIGDTHDGSGGVSGGPSALTNNTMTSGTYDASELLVAASEDGFFFCVGIVNAAMVLVERLRHLNGAVSDDLVALLMNGSGTAFAHARAGVGAVTTQPPIVLAGMTGALGAGSLGSGAMLVNGDGDEIPILGPFWPKGDPFYGAPRLAFLGPANDYTAGNDYDRVTDGGPKTYFAAAYGSSNLMRWMVATE